MSTSESVNENHQAGIEDAVPSNQNTEKMALSVSPQDDRGTSAQGDGIDYVTGSRYWAIVFVIAILFFLTTLDAGIAATSLVAITDDLGGFQLASWILTSYLLGYVAVIVILAKFSDIFGRKAVTIGCIIIFTASSAGCAASQTLNQLIILRAFQGVGGGGSFALASVLLIESVPPEKYADAVSKNGIAVILGLVLGPILGGAISENTTWRWIFIINAPIGAIVLAIAWIGIPDGFPYQNRKEAHQSIHHKSRTIWARIDVPGALLIFLATLSFTACFQEADSRFDWDSAYVIVLLALSIILWALLLIWERRVTIANQVREPVLPWRFFTNRATVGQLINFVMVGAPIGVTSFQLPQRFQLINGMSNFNAGVRLIPFGVAFASGTMISGKLAKTFRVPGIYLVFLGAVLQVIGYALLGTLQPTRDIQPGVYGYEVLSGFGSSFSYSNLIMLVAFTAEKRDGATAMGAANQFRAMGSAMGLAVVTSVFNGHVVSQLARLGIDASDGTVVSLLSADHSSVQSNIQDEIRNILSEGYNRQMLVLAAFGAAQIPLALLMWRRKQVVVA